MYKMEHLTIGDGLAIFGVCGTIIIGIIAYMKTESGHKKDSNNNRFGFKNNGNGSKVETAKAMSKSEHALELGKSAATEILCKQRYEQNHELISNLDKLVKDNGKKLDILIRDISLLSSRQKIDN